MLRSCRASFLHRRKRVHVFRKKKKKRRRGAVCVPGRIACRKSGFYSTTVPRLRTLCAIELFFQADFRRSSAGVCMRARARPVIGGRCRSNCARRPVSICRSDYFVPPKRGDCRVPRRARLLSRRQFAISCQFRYLSCCVRPPRATRVPACDDCHILSRCPSFSNAERALVPRGVPVRVAARCNLIAVTNSMNAVRGGRRSFE